jgi:hypothetical protein
MKATGIVQAVIILLLLAFAASCEVSREYSNRVFKSQPAVKEKKPAVRFMESDSVTASVVKGKTVYDEKESIDSLKTTEIIKKPEAQEKQPVAAGTRTKKVRQ